MRKLSKNEEKKIESLKGILISRSEIVSAFIFGSFLQNEDYHDIDIGVFLQNDLSSLDLMDYEFDLEQILSEKFPDQNFDIRVLNNAPERFLYSVFQGLFLFTKDEKIESLMEKVMRKVMDQEYYDIQYIKFAFGDCSKT